MIRRSFRMGLKLGVLAGLVVAIVKLMQSRQTPAPASPARPWTPLDDGPAATTAAAPRAAPTPPLGDVPSAPPEPVAPVEKSVEPPKQAPPRKKAAAKEAPSKKAAKEPAAPPWVEPTDGICPTTHPVKAKLSSMIFHLPGMFAYDRTHPDRCYRDAVAAESDGLRSAKR